MQAGCFSGFFGATRRRRPTPSTSSRDQPRRAVPVTTEASDELPEYARFTSCCDFWGSGGKELDLQPPSYFQPLPAYCLQPGVIKTIEEKLDELNPELRELSLKIHDHPELAFEERYAHDTLTAFMASHGFSITKHYLGLDTAWRAEASHGHGGRILGVNSEMDALPGIGHACGHNLIAVAGVGIAIAVKEALKAHDIAGKVVLLGTPAEESGSGKQILLDRGGYKDMDACIMCHPSGGAGPTTSDRFAVGSSLAMQSIDVEFFGHTAHAAAAPWEGINALDAAFLAYSSISVLRQQIKPDHRVQGTVSGKNWAANVIPDYAKMKWIVRAPTWDEVDGLRNRVVNCLQAAALSTGCKATIAPGDQYRDLHQNSALVEDFASTSQHYGIPTQLTAGLPASTDFGNITYACPALHPAYLIPTEPNGSNHTPGFARAARTPAAHGATMRVARSLALTGVRVLADAAFAEQVKQAYEASCGSAEMLL